MMQIIWYFYIVDKNKYGSWYIFKKFGNLNLSKNLYLSKINIQFIINTIGSSVMWSDIAIHMCE